MEHENKTEEMGGNSQEQCFLRGYEERHSKRKSKVNNDRSNADDVLLFWSNFTQMIEEISRDIGNLVEQNTKRITKSPDSESMSLKIHQIEQMITDSAIILSPYDIKRSQQEVAKVKSDLEMTKAKVAPRQKFSFRSKARKKKASEACVDPTKSIKHGTDTVLPAHMQGSIKDLKLTSKIKSEEKENPQNGISSLNQNQMTKAGHLNECAGLFSLLNEQIIITDDQSSQTAQQDFMVKDLTGCIIALLKPFGCLRLENLQRCKLFCGPVSGSVYVEGCTSSVIMVAPRQVRIHNTSDCHFYTHPASGPIIEDCTRLQFAKYTMRYDGWERHMQIAQICKDISNWSSIKDFKWHKIQQSPNWSILREEDYLDLSKFDFLDKSVPSHDTVPVKGQSPLSHSKDIQILSHPCEGDKEGNMREESEEI
mmetsp:Transcript_9223/g.12216  ORF Transcript_9223/g.12216 Transcript_9223/m.12216 type:complete len:424 (-) Transcript_9223:115-1386(-)